MREMRQLLLTGKSHPNDIRKKEVYWRYNVKRKGPGIVGSFLFTAYKKNIKGDGRNFSRSNKGVYVCCEFVHSYYTTTFDSL
ncbi:hypothetical protein GCM10020331_078160 [Ectobacillus funiculus]